MSKNNIYADADKHLEAMKKEIATLFIRFLAMGFDELNILGTTILTKRLYDELIAINKKHYLEVAVKSYRMAEGKKEISEEWLEDELLAYHYSTGFLYLMKRSERD